MAISELQMGLVGAGGVLVVGIFAFNKWQERKHRKLSEPVVVQEPGLSEQPAADGTRDRVEPVIGAEAPPPSAQSVKEASARRVPPQLPAEVDERADWVVRIESIEPVVAGRLWEAAAQQLQAVAKPIRWFGFSDAGNRWEAINAQSTGSYHWVCAALQLVDRRGAASDGDLVRVAEGLQHLCDVFMAIPSVPARGEALARAVELDRFCAGVDIQIGVNVLAREQPFAGSKLRSLAEAAGMELLSDGAFHARDEAGGSQFVLSNLEPTPFLADNLRTLTTRGVTLMLEVPRVSDGVQVFERMMVLARQLAAGLNGTVVDDNRAPFGDKAASMVRTQLEQFHGEMSSYGITPGSVLARRLFS